MWKMTPVILFILVIVAACVSPPTQKQIDAADHGPRPSNPRQIAESWVKAQLKDPYSARFERLKFQHGWIKTPPLLGNKFYAGWLYCGTVNAKNSFGAYVGSRVFVVVINRDVVTHGSIDSARGLANSAEVCSKLN